GRPYEHAQARSGAAGRSRRVLRGRIRRADGQRRRAGRGQRRRRRSRPRRHARARLGLRGRARSRPARRRRLSPPCQTSCVMKLSRVWELAREYWFDALVLGGLAWWLADTAVLIHHPHCAQGPLWFDVLAILFFTTPLLARRDFPVASLVVPAVAIGVSSFIDAALVTHPFIAFAFGLTICFRFGMRPWRLQ